MTMYSMPAGLAANFAALSDLKSGYIAPIPTAIPDRPKDRPIAVRIAVQSTSGSAPRMVVEETARVSPIKSMGRNPGQALALRNSRALIGPVLTIQKPRPSLETAEN